MSSCCNIETSSKKIEGRSRKFWSKNRHHPTFLLIGTPNVGKSTFFNKVTWQNSPVGNADRITVCAKLGTLRSDRHLRLLDLPGCYSLCPSTKDEEVVIKNIYHQQFNGCINILGANSIKRDLNLTIQLLEAHLISDICINMIDELPNVEINSFGLSRKLGVKVHLISATKSIGIKQTISSLLKPYEHKQFSLDYGALEPLIQQMCELIRAPKHLNSRFLAIQYLLGNYWIHQQYHSIKSELDALIRKFGLNLNDTKQQIIQTRLTFIDMLISNLYKPVKNPKNFQKRKTPRILTKFDHLLMNPWFGIPFFILILIAIYYITFGSYAGGFINEKFTGALEQLQEIISNSMAANTNASEWIRLFVTDGLLGGIFTVIGFLPYIIIMFLLINIIDQTGYLGRTSLLLDNTLSKFGISGKSVITLITGIGCNIPSMLMARNAQSKKERTIVLLISPLVACSARLVVFVWIANQFINNDYSWLVGIGFTAFSGFIALFMGLVFSQTMFRNHQTFLLTELSKWRKPSIFTTLKKVAFESWDFIRRVMTIIFIANLIIFLLTYISPTAGLIVEPFKGGSGIDTSNASFLQYISIGFQYLFYPIGLGEDYRFAASLLAAAPAKELAASSLELMYGSMNGFHDALVGPQSLISLPIASIVSYLMFFTFYSPCFSSVVVMRKEGGWKNMWISLFTCFVLAYLFGLFSYAGVGSIELAIKNPLLFKNGLLIISWVVFAVIAIIMLINNLGFMHQKYTSIAISYQKYHKYALVNWCGLGFIVLACVLPITFNYVYS